MIPNDKLADPFRLPKSAFFDIICMGLICFSLFSGLHKRYFNKYLSWLAGWIFFVIFMNFYLPFILTFNNSQTVNFVILEPMLHCILGLWATYIVLSYFEKDDYEKIIKAVCISAFLISSVGLLQVLGIDIFGKISRYKYYNKLSVFLDNPGIVANYLALSLPFFLIRRQRIFKIGFILSVITIIISKSYFAMGCASIGLSLYLLLKNRNKIFRSGFIIFWLSIFGWAVLNLNKLIPYFSGRLWVWKEALKHFKDNPVFGQGLGVFQTFMITDSTHTKWSMAHNDWFELAIQIGIVGIVLLLAVLINSFRKFNYKSDNEIGFVYFASFATFLLLMLGSFPLEIAPLALFGLLNFWAVEAL